MTRMRLFASACGKAFRANRSKGSHSRTWTSVGDAVRPAWAVAAGVAGFSMGLGLLQTDVFAESKKRSGQHRVFTLKEFQADHDGDVWVTRNGGVYNVTAFLDAHPGGPTRILMVNGLDLSVFWDVYKLHDRPHIHQLLEEYRIGSLSLEDQMKVRSMTKFADAYTNDPPRPRAADALRVPSTKPWNSEPKTQYLVESFFTPNDLFFVRNHNPVPVLTEKDYELEVEANDAVGLKASKFTLHDLKTKFQRHEVVSALQCAGNRQEEFVTTDRPLYVAPHWRDGAIGNAIWAGVKVRDVLRACGMNVDGVALGTCSTNGMKLINFIAHDTDETGTPYAGVIPIEKVIDPFGDALLAYEMNGETLPRDHGFPIRLLAPGHAGCRNVKWVASIVVSAEASELDSGSRLDRHFAPDVSWVDHRKHVDPQCPKGECRVRIDQGPVIQTLPVQSIICVPPNKSVVPGMDTDHVTVRGIAWSGAGRGICRVELSLDGGKTFTAANLHHPPASRSCPTPETGMGRNWAWEQWSLNVPIPSDKREQLRRGERVKLEIVSKAVDGDFNSQPEDMSHLWNVLGICVNHWSRATVTLDPELSIEDPLPPAPTPPPPGSCIWPHEAPALTHWEGDVRDALPNKNPCK